jgi:hypothetical protein
VQLVTEKVSLSATAVERFDCEFQWISENSGPCAVQGASKIKLALELAEIIRFHEIEHT